MIASIHPFWRWKERKSLTPPTSNALVFPVQQEHGLLQIPPTILDPQVQPTNLLAQPPPPTILGSFANTTIECGDNLPDAKVAVEDNCATQPEITTKYTETRIETTIPGETTILRTYS
jgi:hypothetical protein